MKTLLFLGQFLFLSFLVINSSFSQKYPAKFGKIDIHNLKETSCPVDPNAHAYFLFDRGFSRFQYADTKVDSRYQGDKKGFQLFFTRHFRIKILDNQGYSWGNIEIPLYHENNNSEEILRIKAFTYNLENGKINKTKLEKDDINDEESGKNWNTTKFAMPNIKNGSIVEVEYTVKSDFLFNLQEWYFQRTIPTLLSEYIVEIPEYFNYNQTQSGYLPINRDEKSRRRELTITYNQAAEGTLQKKETYTNKFDYNENIYKYTAKNIPAFPDEQFLKTKKNYLSKIGFELNYTKFEHQSINYYTTSWEEIDKDLNQSYDFGKKLNQTNHWKEDIDFLKSLSSNEEKLLCNALNLVKKRISWNGINSKYAKSSLNKSYKDGDGNCSEVNLNLVVLLKELGFESYPVLLSTRSNGIIHPSHPSVSSFNYVIAMVKHNGKTYLMDATDSNSDLNLLPVRCLNDKGRVIGSTPEKWINLMDYKCFDTRASYQLSLDEELAVHGKITKDLKEYAAYQQRKDIKETNDIDEYTEMLENELANCTIKNLEIVGLDSLEGKFRLSYDVEQSDFVNATDEMIFFSPIIDPFFAENPFKLEKREFPVEFNYPYKVQQIYTINIPEKYKINEIPEALVVTLPENSGRFMYQAKNMGNSLYVTSTMLLNKSLFIPDEYEYLKKFFQLIIDKQSELVVLKAI